MLACIACTQLPPSDYLTPEFEEVTIDDSKPDAVRFICTMSSMSQLTEYGMIYTSDLEASGDAWTQIAGIKTGSDSFEVLVTDFAPGTTYCYRMFISNGRDVLKSSQNYYSTLE